MKCPDSNNCITFGDCPHGAKCKNGEIQSSKLITYTCLIRSGWFSVEITTSESTPIERVADLALQAFDYDHAVWIYSSPIVETIYRKDT